MHLSTILIWKLYTTSAVKLQTTELAGIISASFIRLQTILWAKKPSLGPVTQYSRRENATNLKMGKKNPNYPSLNPMFTTSHQARRELEEYRKHNITLSFEEDLRWNQLQQNFQTWFWWRFNKKKQDAQLSQRDRTAGCVIVLAKSRRPDILSRPVSELSQFNCSNFAPMRSLWLKISGTRGRLPPIIFACIVRPMNALQLCRWQFWHKETL